MKFWWFKKKYNEMKIIISLIGVIPDLSLRIFVIIVSISLFSGSFFTGLLIGKKVEASREISFSGLPDYVPDKNMLLIQDRIKTESNINEMNYVAASGGSVYYYKNCTQYKRIKEENRIWFSTKEEVELNGYELAKNCKI